MKKTTSQSPDMPAVGCGALVLAFRASAEARAGNLPSIESPSFPKIAVRQMEIMNLTLHAAEECAEEGDFETTAELLKLAAGDACFVAAHKREIKARRVKSQNAGILP